jgi:platelet-activating factor acetylhydrolase IB subunit alpha
MLTGGQTQIDDSVPLLNEPDKEWEGFDEATSKKYEGLLEKKWTSVVRLQKKVGSRDAVEAQH